MKSLKKIVLKIIEMSEEDYFKQLNSDKKFIIEDSHQTSNMMRKNIKLFILNMRNVILIGGAGYVGTVIAEELLRKRFNVTILDNFIYKNFNSIKHLQKNDHFKLINGNFSDLNKVNLEINDSTDVIILVDS